MKRPIVAGIVLATLALAFFLGSLGYARVVLPLGASRYVTALDRAGVFSEEELRDYDPVLAQNLRHNLGPFITQDHQRAVELVLLVAIALTAINLTLFLVLRRSSSKAKRPPVAQQTGTCSAAGAAS